MCYTLSQLAGPRELSSSPTRPSTFSSHPGRNGPPSPRAAPFDAQSFPRASYALLGGAWRRTGGADHPPSPSSPLLARLGTTRRPCRSARRSCAPSHDAPGLPQLSVASARAAVRRAALSLSSRTSCRARPLDPAPLSRQPYFIRVTLTRRLHLLDHARLSRSTAARASEAAAPCSGDERSVLRAGGWTGEAAWLLQAPRDSCRSRRHRRRARSSASGPSASESGASDRGRSLHVGGSRSALRSAHKPEQIAWTPLGRSTRAGCAMRACCRPGERVRVTVVGGVQRARALNESCSVEGQLYRSLPSMQQQACRMAGEANGKRRASDDGRATTTSSVQAPRSAQHARHSRVLTLAHQGVL